MDTSKKYIKMCEKAQEIQILKRSFNHKWIFIIGDYFDRFNIQYLYDENSDNPPIKDTIWLPRQDQLQEMIKGNLNEKIYKFNSFICPPCAIKIEVDDEKLEEFKKDWLEYYNQQKPIILIDKEPKWEYIQPFNDYSFEMLWLMLVMKENYNKTWSEKQQNWVKE